MLKLVTTPERQLLAAPFYSPNDNSLFRLCDDMDLQRITIEKKIHACF